MRVIFSLLLFVFSLFALPLEVDEHLHVTTTAQHQYGLVDETHRLKAHDVFAMPLSTPLTQYTYTHAAIWTKTTFKNTSAKPLHFVLRNLRPGTDKIDIFLFEKGELVATHALGDQRPQAHREILSSKSAFALDLEPFAQITMLSRFESWGTFDLIWQVLSPKAYTTKTNLETIFYGLFGGIMVALMLFSLSFYAGLKEHFFLLYAVQGFFTLWSVYATDGVFYMLDLGFNLAFISASTWLATALLMAFSSLFITSFFDLGHLHVRLALVLKGFAGVMVGYSLLFGYAAIFNARLFVDYSAFYLNLSFLFCLLILSSALWAWYKKITGALYIVLGEFFYILCILYVSLSFKGVIESSHESYLILPVGILLEMLFFLMAISAKIKQIKTAAQHAHIASMRERELIGYGKMVGNIAHQWKNGLAQIGALNTEMRLLLDRKSKHTHTLLQERLIQSEEAIHFLLETMQTFLHHYKSSPTQSSFRLKDTLLKAIKMIDLELKAAKIELIIEASCDLEVHGSQKEWYHVWLNLLSNSLAAANKSGMPHPCIRITYNERELRYEDTCGGMEAKTLMAIQKGEQMGLGLKMVQEIVQNDGFLWEIGATHEGFWCTIRKK